MSAEDNKKIVVSFFENFSSGKMEQALAMMSDNATWSVMGKPDKFALAGTKTKAQFTELVKGIGAAMPKGLRVTAKGKVYNNMYHFFIEVRGGKIQAVREYLDTIHAQDVLVG